MKFFQLTQVPEIPYYYSCHLPLIDEVIRYSGSYSCLSLLANSELLGVPFLSSGDTVRIERIKKFLGSRSGYYSLRQKTFPTFEEGLSALQETLDSGMPVIVSGTSYGLPYHSDYRNPVFIEKHTGVSSDFTVQDHWLLVTGFENGMVCIYDPVPSKYLGTVSVDDFKSFWSGNRCIEAFQESKGYDRLVSFGVMEVTVNRVLSEANRKGYFEELLTALVREYERGYTGEFMGAQYAVGRSALLRMRKLLEEAHLNAPEELRRYAKSLFDLRWPHYFMRDLLQDMTVLFGDSYLSLQNQANELINGWEELFVALTVNTQRKKKDPQIFEKFLARFDRLVEEEDSFYSKDLSHTHISL